MGLSKLYVSTPTSFHFAITGKTAAEIVYDKADSKKEHMGLITWKYSPDGRILQSDVTVAKNYLTEKEIKISRHCKNQEFRRLRYMV